MQKVSEIKIEIPKYPKIIIDTLEKNGYEAYIVGGCVRDALLGSVPSDYDITTNADPQTIKKLFKRTIDTGIKHGTVTVLFYENDKPYTYEVTTFRIDGEYDDARHPKDVVFVNDLKEDLLRRDFTVNAMAYNDRVGLVDEFGGIVDLDKKIIRAVGNPVERFTEDALRLLRAVRFAAKLGFEIEEETKNAIPKLAPSLSMVSKERVQVELTKTICSNNPEFVKMVFGLNLSKYITDEFDSIRLGKFEKNLSTYLSYTCLLYNTDIKLANKILKDLRLDNNNISKIMMLLESREYYKQMVIYFNNKNLTAFDLLIKELINYLGYDLANDFVKIVRINEKFDLLHRKLAERIWSLNEEKSPIFLRDLKVDGKDMIAIGFSGQEIGVALNSLLKIVHKNKDFNDKKLLQEIAKKAYNTYKGVPYEL